MDSIIFHIDVNSAFLSWSAVRLLREGYGLDIRTIPSVIGGDRATRHGIVVAKSIPAKKFGIQTAEPVASALKKCPTLLVIPPEHSYYKEQSRMLMEYLSEICPVIEQVSIDECYMLFDPVADAYPSPEEAAGIIKDGVRETFGFTVNVGISNRKVLAKMASDFEKPDKVHTLYSYEIKEKLWPLPVEALFMCGKSASAKFRSMGICTIGDLANTDKKLVEGWMKRHGEMLWAYANGLDESKVEPVHDPAKGVGNSITLSHDVTEAGEACAVLKNLASSVAKRLKKKQRRAGSLSVEIRYADFSENSHQAPLVPATNEEHMLYQSARRLFEELWNGNAIRLLGVRTARLEDESEPQQISLFSYQKNQKEEQKRKKLDEAMQAIRTRYGEDAIQKGLS